MAEPTNLWDRLTTISSEVHAFTLDVGNVIQKLQDMKGLEERLLADIPNTEEDRARASYRRGAISAYNDCIRMLTK